MAKTKKPEEIKVIEAGPVGDPESRKTVTVDGREAFDRAYQRKRREQGSAVIGLDRSLLGGPKLFDAPEEVEAAEEEEEGSE